MRITMVKKILEDGAPCKKCAEVAERLERDGFAGRIERVVVADARDAGSEGMRLAERYGVTLAPFFVVEEDGREARVYTTYFKLVREVLEGGVKEEEEEKEILDKGGVDFL